MGDENVSTNCPLDSTIKQLKETRDNVQKANYIKWINSFLIQENMAVNSLENDLRDGLKLFKLIEKLSGEHLGRPSKGNQRFHYIDNVNRCLNFLKGRKIPLEGISAPTIVDGNEKSTLALIGAIMNQHEMYGFRGPLVTTKPKDIKKERDDDEKHKVALLGWCQAKTVGYGIELKDFSTSWQNGLAFNALIHSHYPDLINYEDLDPQNGVANLTNAFSIAEMHFGVPKILNEKDLANGLLDDYAVLIYLARLYQVFQQKTREEEKAVKSNSDKSEILLEIEDVKKCSVRKKLIATFEELQKQQPKIDSAILKRHPSYSTKSLNRTKVTNEMDSPDSGSPTMIQVVNSDGEPWECNECSYVNSSSSTVCAICFNSQPVERKVLQSPVKDEEDLKVPSDNGQTDVDNLNQNFSNHESEQNECVEDSQDKNVDVLSEKNDAQDEREETRISIEAILRGCTVDSLFSKNHLGSKSFDGPTWSCPGCHHVNPDATKVCELCFRTLRQLKSLPFNYTEISRRNIQDNDVEDLAVEPVAIHANGTNGKFSSDTF